MQTRKRRRSPASEPPKPARTVAYRHLRHPFPPQPYFSADRVGEIHETALKVLEELGLKILYPEARDLFRKGGALVDEDSEMVRIGREIIGAALASAPRQMPLKAANPKRDQMMAEGNMLVKAGAGCPNVSDRLRGRRPGTLKAFEDTLKLQQHFDAIHLLSLSAEPQDVPPALRHYDITRAQLLTSDKPMFAFARGRGQVEEAFEMVRLALDLDEDAWGAGTWVSTVINTNSPRQIDNPMAQGIIDFARHGQMSVITPFCLAGAMAPITVEGALVLQHAEALAGITLAQLARAGAPVAYGGFSSNVDMKSGAPAFGTPEHVKLTLGTGQMARHIGLPWRTAAGSASNIGDAQGASENAMGLWAAYLANATMTMHGAGWLEGGLCFGFEKFINDMETLQTLAELAVPPEEGSDALSWEALRDVVPGGHFFDTPQTMERFRDAFYPPLNADLTNFGRWSETGAVDANARATDVWQEVLATHQPPAHAGAAAERLAPYIERRTREGGVVPFA